MQKLPNHEYAPWLMTALLIPLAEAASGASWPFVLAVTAAGMAISCCTGREEPSEWLKCMQGIVSILIITQILPDTHICWQGRMGEYAVPLILLTLAAITVDKGAEQAAKGINVLRYGVIAVTGIVMLTGLKEIEWSHLTPEWKPDNGRLLLLSVLPMMSGKRKGKLWIPLYALTACILLVGVIGTKTTLWEYSRSIGIFGMRLESITAMASAVSNYALLCYLLAQCGTGWRSRGAALMGYAGYLGGMAVNEYLTASAAAALYGVIPMLKNKSKKDEKRC